jgi:site-specific recombinase XerD
VGEITAHGLRHSAATILLNDVGKNLREVQELLREKNIRTTVRYSHVGYEQTRETAEALSQALEGKASEEDVHARPTHELDCR